MNRDQYHAWANGKDSYPEHSHLWVAKFYHILPEFGKETLYRQFGPFPDKDAAAKFAASYKQGFTQKHFISRWKVDPLCVPVETI